MPPITISAAYAEWLKAHGHSAEIAEGVLTKAAEKFPDFAGKAEEFKKELAAGFAAAGSDPASALALATKALSEVMSGTAGVDPQAFGSAT